MPLILDSVKRDLTAVVQWGRQKMQEGDYEKAAQHFCMALDLRPGFLQALLSRGFCYLASGSEERAQRDFAEVINKDAAYNRNAYVLMSLSLKRSGDLNGAIRYLNRCLSLFSGFKPALLARGELSLKVQDFERARADFRVVLQDEPVHLVARRGLADALRGLGNFHEAVRHYSRAISDTMQALEHAEHADHAELAEHAEHAEHAERQHGQEDPDVAEEEEEDADELQNAAENTDRQPWASGADDSTAPGDTALEPSTSVNQQMSSFNDDSRVQRQEELLAEADPERLRSFLVELLMRRALVLRLLGNLDGAGSDFVDALELEPEEGLALFWYGKVLIEQQRHQEAVPYLQASIQFSETTQTAAHAILGALLMTRADPDFETAQRHLKEAARLAPAWQAARITLWICSAAVTLTGKFRDPTKTLSLLDRALAALETEKRTGESSPGCQSARSSGHLAGSGGAAAAVLSARSRSAEEARWKATRALVKSQQALAKGDDLEQALQCRTFLQLVAREPQQRAAPVPAMLFQLRVTALCDLCRWEEAVADCRQAMLIDPGDDATQFTMHVAAGVLKFRDLKFEAAIGCFTKAIRLQPVNTQARLHRAIALACAAWARGMEGSAQETARVVQLLTDAVQDLEAVEQQAMIIGVRAPLGAAHLRAACLCSLGRPEDAWEALCESGRHCAGRRSNLEGHDPCVPRQRALEAEVLVLLRRHAEAIEACSAVLALNSRGHADARVMRGWCLSEMGEVEAAFEDVAAAVALAPDRADVHEVYGDLCLQYGRLSEAFHAYGSATPSSDWATSRLAFKRALAHLMVGHLAGAEQELSRAVRLRPGMPSAVRAKDGVSVLQAMQKCDWRHAHVRLNMLLHQSCCGLVSAGSVPPTAADGLPVIFLPHELMVLRGVCSLYVGDASTAIQDFAAALELARHFSSAADQANWEHRKPGDCLPPEAASREGLSIFECVCVFNMTLCQLRARDYRSALATVERLRDLLEDIGVFNDTAFGLAWFLAGICHLALDGSSDDLAKEAFSRSYSHDSAFVDDFLQRHGSQMSAEQGAGDKDESAENVADSGRPVLRPLGGCPPVPSRAESCDAPPTVVCCLQRPSANRSSEVDREPSEWSPDAHPHSHSQSTRSRPLSSGPPIRFKVRDVVVWGSPSVSWPYIRPPDWKPPTSLARLDFLHQRDPLSMTGGGGMARAREEQNPEPT